MVNPAQMAKIPYDLASQAIRGVYDYTLDGASDLVDNTLESAKNSLTISTQLLNNTLSSAYTEVLRVPDVIADLLFGPTSIPSQARRILGDTAEVAKRSFLDPAWDAASKAARSIWNALPDIPGIDVEQTVRSIVSGIYTYIFGEDEVAAVPTTEVSSSLVSGAEELARKVVAKVDENTQTVRVARSSNIGSTSSASLSEPVVSTSSSAPAIESGSGLPVVVISSIPPSTEEIVVASAVATVADETPVVGNTPEGSTAGNAGGVEVSEGESSPGVFQTILNFLTGTTTDSFSVSSNVSSTAATAQTVGGVLLVGVGGSNGAASSTAGSSPTVVSVVNALPRPVVVSLGGGSQSTTVGDLVLGILTGNSETSNITSISSGLSVAQTLFHAAVSRVHGPNGNVVPSYQRSPWGESRLQTTTAIVLNNIPDSLDVPYCGVSSVSSRSSGQADLVNANTQTVEVVADLANSINGIHFPTGANPDSGSEGGEQNAYETMRDLELAQNLNNPSSQEPTFVYPPFIIRGSNPASVAV